MSTKLVSSPPRQRMALRAFLKEMVTGPNIRTQCVIVMGSQESIESVLKLCDDFVKVYKPSEAMRVMLSRTGQERDPIYLWIDMKGFDSRKREGHDFLAGLRQSRMYLENVVLLAQRLPEEAFKLADVLITIDVNRGYTIQSSASE
jgi:hypothetical protein